MVTRLSTAEILAAARAADGKRPAAMPAAVPERQAEPKAEIASPPSEVPAAAPLAVTPTSESSNGTQPPVMAAILRQVRQDREPESLAAVPHSMHDVLDAVRKDGRPAEVRPASMTTILQRVRELCGTTAATPRAVPVASAPAANTAQKSNTTKKPSTAEILAAARANAKPTNAPGQAKAAAKPTGKASGTADILAAARRQGAVAASGTAAARPEPKPRVATKTAEPATKSAAAVADSSDRRPRPPAMAELLSSVRSSILEGHSRIEYPPLTEMLRELRSVDQRRFGQVTSQRPPDGWIDKVKRWFSGTSDTHQGASI